MGNVMQVLVWLLENDGKVTLVYSVTAGGRYVTLFYHLT